MNYLGPYLLGPNGTPENGIYTGDARELALAIPDESVDLIFTDPVYDQIDDYQWLAETAARVLKPDSVCLVWCGIGYLPETLEALKTHLHYRWQLVALRPTGVKSQFGAYRVFSNWRSLLWYEKGDGRPDKFMSDVGYSNDNIYTGLNGWGKSLRSTMLWLDKFETDVTIDFFCGGGTIPVVCKTLGRQYLAFEIDPQIAEIARQRVRETQPPLFVPEPRQMELCLANDKDT